MLMGHGQPEGRRHGRPCSSMASIRLSPAPQPWQRSCDVANFQSGSEWLKTTFSPLKIPDAAVLGYEHRAPDAWDEGHS